MGGEMITLKRLPRWRAAFEAEADRLRFQPFVWGQNDCALGLAGNLVQTLTGVDMVAPWRGQYDSPGAALRLLRAEGAASLGDMVARMLPEIPPARARIGDLGAIATDDQFGHALCLVDYERVIGLTDAGFAFLDRGLMVRAFKIG